jgi:DNA-binding NarL/FixJ family response regulator
MNEGITIRIMMMVQQPLFREGVLAVLRAMPCEILIPPTTMDEALELARSREPEVALLDTLSETFDMLEMTRHIRMLSPKTAVIILSALEGEEWLFQAVKAGAAAYSTHNIPADALTEAVRRVSQGEYLINDEVLAQPALASRVLQSFREMGNSTAVDDGPREPCPLSNRERDILEHIARGNSNKEIAKLLEISDQTVKNHITSILRKLDVNDRTAAVVCAIKQRWIQIA